MAKLYGSAFAGFSGTVGNLVGYNWKGVWCVRSRPASVRNPRSEAQQRHRAMFAEEVRLAGRMSWAVKLGFAAVADELHMTPQNAFVKANQGAFSSAVGSQTSNGDGYTADGNSGLAVDWETLIVSAGPVAPVALGTPTMSEDGVLSVDFEKNPMHTRANNFDEVHLYVYCPALGNGYLAAPVYRKERHISVSLPDDFIGQEVHVYAFVTDRDGNASESCHAGYSEGSERPEYPDCSEHSDCPNYFEDTEKDSDGLKKQAFRSRGAVFRDDVSG